MGLDRGQARAAWVKARAQHGLLTRSQLLALGLTPSAIEHRLATGRLHRVRTGVYAVGRCELTRHGRWLACVLAAGRYAALSHSSAAGLWGMVKAGHGPLHVTVPPSCSRQVAGARVHRAQLPAADRDVVRGIPVTAVVRTLIDLAATEPADRVEDAIGGADRLDLIDPVTLRQELDRRSARTRGTAALKRILDIRTFVVTHSRLERMFVPLVARAGLPKPTGQRRLGSHRVDFIWEGPGLVVETDGLRYHRTPAQQAEDQRRDQLHASRGFVVLRFSHGLVRYEPRHVVRVLAAVWARLERRDAG